MIKLVKCTFHVSYVKRSLTIWWKEQDYLAMLWEICYFVQLIVVKLTLTRLSIDKLLVVLFD
jgi:hypothetical protein